MLTLYPCVCCEPPRGQNAANSENEISADDLTLEEQIEIQRE